MQDDLPHASSSKNVNNDPEGLKPWERTKSELGKPMMLFTPRTDTVINPRSGESLKRLVLETPDWVNVIARTSEGELVFAKQFRFGAWDMTYEIPGGMVDPGEEHALAARRELREETGYSSNSWTYLGSVQPNPAFHDNRCHHYLAENVVQSESQDLDNGEDIAIVLIQEDEIKEYIERGDIAHSLVITALSRVMDLRP
jgi:ADP-ribose pyrophosphatase